MFFARLGRVLAWVALVLGIIRLALGISVASVDDATQRAAWAAQFLGSGSTGQNIDQAIYTIVFAIALGILAEIGIATHRHSR